MPDDPVTIEVLEGVELDAPVEDSHADDDSAVVASDVATLAEAEPVAGDLGHEDVTQQVAETEPVAETESVAEDVAQGEDAVLEPDGATEVVPREVPAVPLSAEVAETTGGDEPGAAPVTTEDATVPAHDETESKQDDVLAQLPEIVERSVLKATQTATRESQAGEAEVVQAVTLDDEQWEWVQGTVRTSLAVSVISSALVAIVTGAVLTSYFVKGWRR